MNQDLAASETLILLAAAGDHAARGRLLELHWPRLIEMVSLRMDRRLASRLDPADVVQQAMIVATTRMDAYLRDPPIPFYPWLYRLTLDRLARAHAKYERTASREIAVSSLGRTAAGNLPDESVIRLAGLVIDDGTSPSGKLARRDAEAMLRQAMDRLTPKLREVLLMHYLESLTFREIAAILGIGESAVKMRHARALEAMQRQLAPASEGIRP